MAPKAVMLKVPTSEFKHVNMRSWMVREIERAGVSEVEFKEAL